MSLAAAIGFARSLAIYHAQPWRTRALRCFYGGLIRPGDLAFDIGAHVGNRTRVLADLGARTVAVEPQPLFAGFLERFIVGENVLLRREAVGAEAGELVLNISSRHPTVSTLSNTWIEAVTDAAGFQRVRWDKQIVVPVTTLDRLIAEYGVPRLCKIDVEGMEAEILRGLTRPIPIVAVEYLPAAGGIAETCIDRLITLASYRFNRLEGERHQFVHQEWLGAEEIRRELRKLPSYARSGDLYARLESAS